MDAATHIHLKGAREHNLRNLELRIPRGRLVVITGPSGSGKSSLAFDTIYAEGYRKYMESLSAQARQVLEQLKRPDVDFIHGLSPVLAIEQRTGGGSPRSTVATVTEVADYARLLWALCGEQRCPKDGGRVTRRSLDDCLAQLMRDAPGERAIILAPWMRAKPAVLRDEIPRLRQRGFQRLRLAGEIKSLDEPKLIPTGAAEITAELVIDRLVLAADQRSRLADSLELAFREGANRALVLVQKSADAPWREIPLSQHLSCEVCGDGFEPLTPRHFSFNNKEGACPDCGGLGRQLTFSDELVVPDAEKSVRGGAVKPWRIGGRSLIIKHNALLRQLAEQLPYDAETPWKDLPAATRHALLHGAGERLFSFKLRRQRTPQAVPFPGIIADLMESYRHTDSEGFRARLTTYMVSGECPACRGTRFNPRSAAVRLGGGAVLQPAPREAERGLKHRATPDGHLPALGFADFSAMDVSTALAFVRGLRATLASTDAVREVLDGVEQRLHFLAETGLGYLTLDREYATLSGGESQRVRLATQLGMGLVGVIYVLDEPSIGLHPHDNQRLLATLRELRDRGNTVLVVEHDEDTIRVADELIELGPGAGTEGGRVLFQGTPADCARLPAAASRTGAYLAGRLGVEREAKLLAPDDRWLTLKGVGEHNLRNVDARFPVGLLTCVTGVSGSGKSSLVNDVLAAVAARKLNGAKTLPGRHRGVTGLEHFEKTVQVDQSPIGRSPRSNPATFVGLMDLLRDLYALVPLAKVRGYKASRFSFNVRGGRCERCQGDGQIRLDMQFMADAYAPCPSCDGRRFNRETLEVRFHGKNIADVLALTVREATELFRAVPRLTEKLATLDAVGLGYLQLGQSATTLSGGEAQRLKLSLELSKREQGRTLYLLDEPTTGLHWTDIQRLMDLLFKLRDAGNTVVVIEHNLDVMHLADWLIDLGPGGGPLGGEIVYAGPRDGIEAEPRSLTGQALAGWKRAHAQQ
ncbi:MAG: excinuclease ABC subunit UvrA [Opitutae bacterium]|nr:excinuclease ABC subunit UvrA [Opitutae bacterium]